MQQTLSNNGGKRAWRSVAGGALALACTSMAWALPDATPVAAPAVMPPAHALPQASATPDASAAPDVIVDRAIATDAVASAPAAPAASPAPDFGQPADLGLLAQSRGGTDTTHNTANLDGMVSGNSATNVVTGNNIIDSGSFANMSGIPVVIQNSGANVLIQSATIVNLQFK